jgi:hypothetical protein
MILKERVPSQISRFAMCAVVLLGLLTLPGWTQSTAKGISPETVEEVGVNPAVTTAKNVKPVLSPETTVDESRPQKATRPIDQEVKPKVSLEEFKPTSVRTKNSVNQVGPRTTKQTTGSSKKVQVLEQQLRQLQRELQTLRNRRPRWNPMGRQPNLSPFGSEPKRPRNSTAEPGPILNESGSNQIQKPAKSGPVVTTHTITLQRTTYRLPVERSKALEIFLRTNVKTDVLSIKINPAVRKVIDDLYSGPGAAPARNIVTLRTSQGDTVTITTTPEVQRVIGGLIQIMRKDTPKNTGMGYESGGEAGESSASGYPGSGRRSPEGFEGSGGTGLSVKRSRTKLTNPRSSGLNKKTKLLPPHKGDDTLPGKNQTPKIR